MKTTATNQSLKIDMTEALSQLTEEDWNEIMENAKAIAKADKKPKKKKKTDGGGGQIV